MIKVLKAKANDDFTIELEFSDGSLRRFDATPYLNFPVFRELRSIEQFRKLRVAYGTVHWDNDADISPETLYLESKPLLGKEQRDRNKKNVRI